MSLRKALFWVHLAVGISAGAVILLMSVTGVLLTYQRQMTAWADRGYRVQPAAQRAPAATLLASASSFAPDATPTGLTFRSDPAAPASVALGRGRVLYLDPYTGKALGEGAAGMRAVFRVVTDLHRWLAMTDASRATGRAVTGAANLGFLFLVTSGLFLWVPKRWTRPQVKAVLLPRRGLGGKARDYNWHHVLGIWFAIPLAIVVASGAVISYPWASGLVYRAMGEQPPAPARPAEAAAPARPALAGIATAPTDRGAAEGEPRRDGPAPLQLDARFDSLVATAMAQTADWKTVTVSLPVKNPKKVPFAIDAGDGGQPQLRQTLTLDAASGAVVAMERFEDGSRGRRLRSILRFAHTGEVMGIPGQTIAGLASLAGAVLVWTGLALSYRRLMARVRRARTVPVGQASPAL